MIYSAEAERHIDELRQHYDALNRIEAARNLIAALVEAEASIQDAPFAGLKAPRPYPQLAQAGRLWIGAGNYWIAYSTSLPPVMLAVFHNAADIPGRL